MKNGLNRASLEGALPRRRKRSVKCMIDRLRKDGAYFEGNGENVLVQDIKSFEGKFKF